ncbi:hypothetical protein FLK61_41540 [Paenalkalicoccus suaedae]|uniref:YhfM-like domain-containing protein n=1 Tax=Paenalkalicoccus suaedae TaxID=2592382 RepID=A0A859FJU2_9BACI|nr:hypothetical protein [Paenalkalicoccus suaedae]QKS73075.1 hypothetical protein FLK61_41540 [Paenalkalicoccus suaedae]
MKYMYRISIFILSFAILSACTTSLPSFSGVPISLSTSEIVLYETTNFQSGNLELVETFSASEDITVFRNAARSADRVDGVVDMAEPDYEVHFINEDGEVTDELFLWIGEETGSMMDKDDTHTVYTLTESDASAIQSLLE